MYELFEHTADLGLRVRAADLDTLFAEAAQALFSAVVDDLATITPTQQIAIKIDGADREFLLFDWLRELLFHLDAEQLLLGKFAVNVRDDGLTAIAWGEPMDRARHKMEHEVKAITYHGLRLEKTCDEWLAEVIVDI